jgi:predicted Zn-dependent peptidase
LALDSKNCLVTLIDNVQIPTTTLTHTLSNGLTIIGEPLHSKQAAAFSFLIPSGSATEPQGKEGLTNVLEGTLYRGAGKRNARELGDALDGLGIERSGSADIEYTTFSGATLGLYLHEALEIYADILLRPVFPEDDWEGQRTLALNSLKGLDDAPSRKLFVHLRQKWFTSEHRRSVIGTKEGLESLQLDDLRQDFNTRFKPQGAILALAGNFEWDATIAHIENLFGEWHGNTSVLEAPQIVDKPLREYIPSEKEQVHIGVAYRGVAPDDSDNYAYRLSNAVLSGGMGARLFTEVREKRGLVYSVSASVSSHRGIGWTTAYAGTTAPRAQETLDVLLAELKRMEKGVTQEELDRARTKMLTALVMAEESTRSRAASIARDFWILGRVRSLDELEREIGAITVKGIQAFYERHPVEELSVVTLGPTELKL